MAINHSVTAINSLVMMINTFSMKQYDSHLRIDYLHYYINNAFKNA